MTVEPYARRVDERRHGVFAGAAVVLFGALIVILHVIDYTRVSPLDELQHYDYMIRVVRDQEVVLRGDQFTQEAVRTEACEGLDAEFQPPPCRPGHYDPPTFQEGGFNTAYIHNPAYYAVSGAIAAGMSGAVGSDSLFTTGRLTGALWLAAGLVLIWLCMAELVVPLAIRLVILALVITAPLVIEASSVITPDATALLAGAAVLHAVLRIDRGARWWPAGLVAIGAVALKSTNVLAVVLGIVYLGMRHLQLGREARWGLRDRTAIRRSVLAIAAMVGGALIVGAAWGVYSSSRARVPTLDIPMARRFHTESIGIDEFLRNVPAGITPLDAPYVPSEMKAPWVEPFALLVDRFFLVGLASAALLGVPGSRQRGLAMATFVTLALMGPIFVIVNFVFQGTYVGIPHRYGLSLVPALVVSAVALLANRRVFQAVAVIAGLVSVATVLALVR